MPSPHETPPAPCRASSRVFELLGGNSAVSTPLVTRSLPKHGGAAPMFHVEQSKPTHPSGAPSLRRSIAKGWEENPAAHPRRLRRGRRGIARSLAPAP